MRRTAQADCALLRHLAKEAPDQQRWESMIDLSGAYLGGASLYEADLRVAVLAGADLTNADLHDTDLRRADLRRVNLTKADLMYACLTEREPRAGVVADGRPRVGQPERRPAFRDEPDRRQPRRRSLTAADLVEADLSAVYWTKETSWPLRLQREILLHSTSSRPQPVRSLSSCDPDTGCPEPPESSSRLTPWTASARTCRRPCRRATPPSTRRWSPSGTSRSSGTPWASSCSRTSARSWEGPAVRRGIPPRTPRRDRSRTSHAAGSDAQPPRSSEADRHQLLVADL